MASPKPTPKMRWYPLSGSRGPGTCAAPGQHGAAQRQWSGHLRPRLSRRAGRDQPLHIPFPSYVPTAVAASAGTLVVAVLVWVAASERRARSTTTTLAVRGLLAALVTLWLGLCYRGTHYYHGGISIDQSFRTQALARYAATPALTDMNYLRLPSFYARRVTSAAAQQAIDVDCATPESRAVSP